MILKKFLLNSSDIKKSTYIWNMIGSMLNAFQSVIFLMILTRVMDLSASGIFTIAFADANLFLLIGKYGVRYFQASDSSCKYHFASYRRARVITTILMLLVSLIYIVITAKALSYSSYKAWVVLVMCIFKLPDAYEDVYFGEYQRLERLDVASKTWSLRLILSMLVFAISLFATGDLLWAAIITSIANGIAMFILLYMTKAILKNSRENEGGAEDLSDVTNQASFSSKGIFLECMPLFISTFLAFYLVNAPKYSIDALMTDEIQARFGFVAMPVFVVTVLTSMIYNPVIHKLSMDWEQVQLNGVRKEVWKQLICVLLVTTICLLGAFILGIPVLSWLYNTELSDYKFDLLIMLLGGGFLAASNWMNAVLTIMRLQKIMLVGYILISLMALISMNIVTSKFGVHGVSLLFTLLMFLLMLIFVLIYLLGMRRKKHE